MENLEVAYQYYDGGPEHYNEPLVENVTECEGVIYLTHGKLCIHNYLKLDVEEVVCYVDDSYRYTFKDNIQSRIDYIENTPGCEIMYLDWFSDYIDVSFDNEEVYNQFVNHFNK